LGCLRGEVGGDGGVARALGVLLRVRARARARVRATVRVRVSVSVSVRVTVRVRVRVRVRVSARRPAAECHATGREASAARPHAR